MNVETVKKIAIVEGLRLEIDSVCHQICMTLDDIKRRKTDPSNSTMIDSLSKIDKLVVYLKDLNSELIKETK